MISGWIDIHCHIMPGVDDGAKNWIDSRQMLRMSYSEGVRKIIATPHYNNRLDNPAKEELEKGLIELRKMAAKIHRNFEIYLGNELYYDQYVQDLLQQKKIHTLADSDYILVEFSPSRDFDYIKYGLQQLQMEGFIPVLAHIERYKCLLDDISRVEELAFMGIYLQVNASSILGNNGTNVKRFLKRVLSDEMVHIVATDAHNTYSRPPKLNKCSNHLISKYGMAYTNRLLYKNPMKIINNEII